jgi:hypothetical protein
VLAYFQLTLRQGLRLPAVWILTGLGVLATLSAFGLSVLALGESTSASTTLLAETAQTTAAWVALWLLAVTHDADARSGFVQAADQTFGGVAGRFVGRLAGAAPVAVLATIPTIAVGVWMGAGEASPVYLLSTTIAPALLLGAWATLLLALTGSASFTVFADLALWLAGHLPWGAGGWGSGLWGEALAAWLPGRVVERPPDLPAVAAATGLVLVALACARPARSTS